MTEVFFTKHAEEQLRSKMTQSDRKIVFDVLAAVAKNDTLARPVFTTTGGPVTTATGVTSDTRLVYEIKKSQWRVLFSKRGDDIIVLTIMTGREDKRAGLQEVLTSVVTEVSAANP